MQHYPISTYDFGQALNHNREYSSGIHGGIAQITVPVSEPRDPKTLFSGGDSEVDENRDEDGEEEMNPEQGGAFGDVSDGGFGEAVSEGGGASGEVEGEEDGEGEGGEGEEEGTAAALDEEELRGVGAAVSSNFAAGGVPDGEELRGEGGGTRHAAVVAAELHEEEDQKAARRADRGYVEQVVDVAVPGAEGVAFVTGGRRRRREGVSHRKLGFSEV